MTAMEGGKTNEKTKKTDLHGTALHLLPVFYGFCAGIGGRNGARRNDYLSNRSGEAEVSTAADLTSALGDSNISKITLEQDIPISDTLTVNRAVTLDLNGFVLQRTGEGSVIKVEQGGELTIADSNKNTAHKFAQNTNGLWELVDGSSTSSKTVNGGIITGGKAQNGGGVYVAPVESCI